MEQTNGRKFVSRTELGILVTITIAIIGGLFIFSLNNQAISQDNRVEISGIQVNIENIDKNIEEIKKMIKNGN